MTDTIIYLNGGQYFIIFGKGGFSQIFFAVFLQIYSVNADLILTKCNRRILIMR